MPRGDKSSYSNKQKRQAEHIEEGYEKRGTPKKEAERRAWATVNKETGGVPKVHKEEPEDIDVEQAMGDIVAPFERTRAKRVDNAAGDEEPIETPNEAAMM